MTVGDVIDVLIELTQTRGVPKHIRSGIDALYIEPASPWQNGYAESFHARLRDELLNVEVFVSTSAEN